MSTPDWAWPIIDRGDGRIEIACPHGVGHVSEVLSRAIHPRRWNASWMRVHGCDGCCGGLAFAIAEHSHVKQWHIDHPIRRISYAFIEDCFEWRGEPLLGRYAHWCSDWDELPMDETCREWPCACYLAGEFDDR